MNQQLHNQHVIDRWLFGLNQSRIFKSSDGMPTPLINCMRAEAELLAGELGVTNYFRRAKVGAL